MVKVKGGNGAGGNKSSGESKTSTKENTLTPEWNEVLPLFVAPDVNQLCFTVMDKDTMSSDDIMAGVTIQLGDSFCNQDLPLLPKVRKRLCDGSVTETNTSNYHEQTTFTLKIQVDWTDI